MVDKTTPRLGLPVPFLTNPLKIDVGKLTEALTMLDANAVMLTDWDITADGWQKMGTITDLAQGKIALTLMVITGTGFANIVMQTGDGSVTTVGDPARISVTAQTNLGTNEPTILGGKVVETAEDSYEVWFNIAPSTAPRKWSALLAAGNGAKIDWTHTVGAQPAGGVTILIARSLTDQEIASPTVTKNGAVLTAGYAGLMGINLPYYDFAATGDTLISHIWRVGETMRVKIADATTANGFPSGVTGAAVQTWRIHCESVNEDRSVRVMTFWSEGGGSPTYGYRCTQQASGWGTPRRMYTSDNPPKASEVKAVPQLTTISTAVDLNDLTNPIYYGVNSFTSTTGATAANNFPYDEPGTLYNVPYGMSGVNQLFISASGRVAARNYDGSTFTPWRKGANSGANDDITSLTALSGSLKLGGDAVNDYDAVTLRQLRATTGSGGPTMNGVVNNFVGAVEWWQGSRAKLPAGYIPADGQEESQTDPKTAELYAAVKNDVLVTVDEATWLQNPAMNGNAVNLISKRANYVKNSTTAGKFRVPDLNGVQANSIQGLFLRGSAPTWNNGPGTVASDQLRDHSHIGYFYVDAGRNEVLSASAIRGGGVLKRLPVAAFAPPDVSDTQFDDYSYSANEKYVGQRSTVPWENKDAVVGETSPRNAIGIWIIRASGSFQAENTSFEVLTGDTALPGNNTALKGGDLRSVYQINGVDHMAVTLRAAGVVGGNYAPEIEQVSPSGGSAITKKWTLPQTPGELVSKAETGYTSINGKSGGTLSSAFGMSNCAASGFDSLYASNKNLGLYFEQMNVLGSGYLYPHSSFKMYWPGHYGGAFTWSAWANDKNPEYVLSWTTEVGTTPCMWRFNASNGNATATGSWMPTSDERLKNLHGPITDPLAKMQQIRGQTWNMKEGGAFGVGFTAQDVQRVFPDSVHSTGDKTLSDGTVVKDVLAPDTYGVAAGLHHEAILALLKRIEVLETKLKDK